MDDFCRLCGNGLDSKAERLIGECIKCASGLTKESKRLPEIKAPKYGRLTNSPGSRRPV